jgi:DNA-binding Lrp family transcriptional regulator|uniref:siroheme decarboxylase n=1 Tax=Desulfobacca acetoxidans TaxID=60893 RepID=A0A7V6A3K2_9BACT
MDLSDFEKKVILSLQRDLDIVSRPFLELARQLGASEEEFLAAVQALVAKGYIRRFGATLRHQLSGYGANALVAWAVPECDVRRVGRKLSQRQEVTHCYHRLPAPGWPYNLYTMLHGKDPRDLETLAASLAGEVGLQTYEILFSDTELKKTTMRYFREESSE